MRVPFGSSNTRARSCGQNSPSMPPRGVTLTVWANAGTASVAAARAAAAIVFFIGVLHALERASRGTIAEQPARPTSGNTGGAGWNKARLCSARAASRHPVTLHRLRIPRQAGAGLLARRPVAVDD